ncbi:hypothetical protein GCM10017771_68360 [Streptomyces capitiformicae]|uniref:Uncharacterized protein n=1 Tax=Streptomyces capitiformicae TaxID=2014920 RepID=A0A918ZEN6_9ACTN|nr:hypothetical protein [Streptomyces capitiformicae]GHE47499.1 hypothetical protein GCM10017771_68360 [Streptomyces capitiformicae]
MNTVDLRPATPADSEFCFQLHKAAMGSYVTAVWGWDDEDQRAHHERSFRPGRWQIITVDGTDAGLLIVEYGATDVYLGRIELHPATRDAVSAPSSSSPSSTPQPNGIRTCSLTCSPSTRVLMPSTSGTASARRPAMVRTTARSGLRSRISTERDPLIFAGQAWCSSE